MAKRKRPRRVTQRAKDPVWSNLEEAFFASAPPDLPVPVGAVECFDDLDACAPRRSRRTAGAGRERSVIVDLMAALARSGLRRSFVAIGLASLMLVVALTAAVFAR